jgi:cytochrome c556
VSLTDKECPSFEAMATDLQISKRAKVGLEYQKCASHKFSDVTQALPFDEILIGLGQSMENAAKSLFFLQQATIDDNGSDPFPDECLSYRNDLQQIWEEIIGFVEESGEFASEASCLQAVISTDDAADISVYFESLRDKCRGLT